MLVFQTNRLSLPGFYEMKNGGKTLSLIAVNVDKLESDTRRVTDESLTQFWKRLGIPTSSLEYLAQGEQLQTTVLQSRFGTELWKYCIGAALALALTEMALARDSRNAVQPVAG
jgi:hypothetical protein